MADAKKITQEELDAVRTAISNLNRAKTQLGDLEYQKTFLIAQTKTLDEALQEEQKKLEATYGPISVNLETGEYTEEVQEAEEVAE